jgi:probable F420-dependent oxidoreductase
MGIGLSLPQQAGGAPVSATWLIASADAARAAGFDGIWMADHFSYRNPDGSVAPRWETFTMLAAIAARVPEITIGTMVACTGYRNSGVTAKMYETLDEISGGRVIAGLGAGWNRPEYDQFGYPFDHRVSRFEEAIQIIRGLLRDGRVDFQGTYESANNAVNQPRGPRPQGAPILVGSNGDRMLGLLARYADAWHGGSAVSVSELDEKIGKLERVCREYGRDPETVVKTAGFPVAVAGSDDTGNRFVGDAAARADRLAEFRAAGFRHLIVSLDTCTPETITAFGETLAALDATEVLA